MLIRNPQPIRQGEHAMQLEQRLKELSRLDNRALGD
jgi:hypothetical protein